MKTALRLLIRSYQIILRPLFHFAGGGPCCRYTPSCSNYFLQALDIHGLFKGSWLGVCRIFRCHPWSSHGHDPVPSKCCAAPSTPSSNAPNHSPQL